MCLSRFLDDVIETEEYSKGVMTRIEITTTQLREKDELSLDKRVVRLRGVVPFEISGWKTKGALLNI